MLPKITFRTTGDELITTGHGFGNVDAGSFMPGSSGWEVRIYNDFDGDGSEDATSVKINARSSCGETDLIWHEQHWIEVKSYGYSTGSTGMTDDNMTTFQPVGENSPLGIGNITSTGYRTLFVRVNAPTDAQENDEINLQLIATYQDPQTTITKWITGLRGNGIVASTGDPFAMSTGGSTGTIPYEAGYALIYNNEIYYGSSGSYNCSTASASTGYKIYLNESGAFGMTTGDVDANQLQLYDATISSGVCTALTDKRVYLAGLQSGTTGAMPTTPNLTDLYLATNGEIFLAKTAGTWTKIYDNTFLGLSDTPADFTGDASKILTVTTGETAVEFTSSTGINHNDFGGLDSGDYQHLTQAEHNEITQWAGAVTLSTGGAINLVTFSTGGTVNVPSGQGYQINSANVKLDDWGTPDDNTDLNATTGHHGLLLKLTGSTSTYLNAGGAWATPPGATGGATNFLQLTDTPANYTGDASKILTVTTGEDAVEFIPSTGILLDNLGTPEDNTDLNATTGLHGLLPKGDADTTHYLAGDISWTSTTGIVLDSLATPTTGTALNATTGRHGLLLAFSGTTGEYLSATGGWNTPAGAGTFLGLTDTPSDYIDDASKLLRVNASSGAVEFVSTTGIALDTFGTPTDTTDNNASTGYHGLLLKLDGNTSNYLRGDGSWQPPPGATGGEANTASNVNTTGVGVYEGKVGIDLQFKGVRAGSSKATVTDTTGTHTISVDVNSTGILLDSLGTPSTGTVLNATTGYHGLLPVGDGDTTHYLAGDISWTPTTGIVLDSLSTPTTGTALNSSTGRHGLLPQLGGGTVDYLRADGTWATPPGATGGEVNTASNQGTTGIGIYYQKSGVDLQFKAIHSTGNISVTDSTGTITVNLDVISTGIALDSLGTPSTGTALNSSTGRHGLLIALDGTTGNYLRGDGSWQSPPGATGGEVNTASNIGSEVEIFKQKDGVDLEFRTLKAGSPKITLTNLSEELSKYEEDVTGDDDGAGDISSTQIWKGQSFTTTSAHFINKVKVRIKKTGTPGDLSVNFYLADGSHLPTGAVLGTGTLEVGSVGTSYALCGITLNIPFNVSDATEYVFLVYTDTADGSNKYTVPIDMADSYADGVHVRSLNGGSSFSVENANYDLSQWEIYGSSTIFDYIKFDIVESEIRLDDLKATEDNVDLNASTSAHGLLPKRDGNAAHWLDGSGLWTAPTASEVGALESSGAFTVNRIPQITSTGGVLKASVFAVTTGDVFDFGAHSAGFTEQAIATTTGTVAINWNSGNKALYTRSTGTVGGAATFTFTTPVKSMNLFLIVRGSTAGCTGAVTLPTVYWGDATYPTFSTGASAIDSVAFYYSTGLTSYLGLGSANFSTV